MKEIKAYKQINQIYEESYTYIPSGFRGVWIKVTEDPANTLDVEYLNQDEIEKLGLKGGE